MNNVLGLAFIQQFHEATAHLEEGGPRLLHVDSHSSHVNLPFLDFAVQHNIIVLGYPPHTTNLTQGLDVVVFGPFKKAYARHASDHLAKTGSEVQKRDFLSVLDLAVQDAFTEDNILAAWRKTGLRPVNRAAISDLDLAPSKAFSTTNSLPIPPPSPIKAVVDAIHRQNRLRETPPSPNPFSPSNSPFNLNQIPPVNLFPSLLIAPDAYEMVGDVASSQPEGVNEPIGGMGLGTADLELCHLDTSNPSPSIRSSTLELDISGDLAIAAETHAINMAGDILRSLASTSFGPILELETVTSAILPPPVECGPFPSHLVELLKTHQGMPSEALWNVVKNELINLVPRAERLLATNVLQHTFCQQVQRKLAFKENTRKKPHLQKISGFENGLIFTSSAVMESLAKEHAEKDVEHAEAERKRELNELRCEARRWKEAAIEAQKEAHDRLVAEWKATPADERSKRQPAKPRLAQMPEHYQEVLTKKQTSSTKSKAKSTKPKKKQAQNDSDSYAEESD